MYAADRVGRSPFEFGTVPDEFPEGKGLRLTRTLHPRVFQRTGSARGQVLENSRGELNMTRTNNAAKNAAREHQRKTGGNYTTALRHVKRVPAHDGDRDLVVPFAAVDGWFSKTGSNVRGQCIAIGDGMYSSGLILSGGEAHDGALSISLLTALADRYSPQRVNFMAWGFDMERLRDAGLTDYLTDSPRDSLSEFLEAAAVEDKTRGRSSTTCLWSTTLVPARRWEQTVQGWRTW
ncbi:hypothetical protein GCM10020255_027500 [Rhodococcus baikonurensis]